MSYFDHRKPVTENANFYLRATEAEWLFYTRWNFSRGAEFFSIFQLVLPDNSHTNKNLNVKTLPLVFLQFKAVGNIIMSPISALSSNGVPTYSIVMCKICVTRFANFYTFYNLPLYFFKHSKLLVFDQVSWYFRWRFYGRCFRYVSMSYFIFRKFSSSAKDIQPVIFACPLRDKNYREFVFRLKFTRRRWPGIVANRKVLEPRPSV